MLGKIKGSIHAKALLIIAVSIFFAISSFFVIRYLGVMIVEKYYITNERIEERTELLKNDFAEFVAENKSQMTGEKLFSKWSAKHTYAEIFAYSMDDNRLKYYTSGAEIHSVSENLNVYLASDEKFVSIELDEGNYNIYIQDKMEYEYIQRVKIADICIVCCLMLAFLTFHFSMFERRIFNLSKKVKKVYDDNINNEIVSTGTDEISRVAQNVEMMRRTIIGHYRKEQEAIEQNHQLLTALSHDIRTPLTAIIGYTEMITDEHETDIDIIKGYTEICKSRAYQLKEMTDTMFKYFTVYGDVDLKINIEKFDARELLDQLLGEYLAQLCQSGFNLEVNKIKKDITIETDIKLLIRVTDNIFSNIERYGDKRKDIIVSGKEDGKYLTVTVKNTIDFNATKSASTGVGLKTSEKLMFKIGGIFKAEREDDLFIVNLSLPICE